MTDSKGAFTINLDGFEWGTAIAAGTKSVSLTSGKHTITASYTLTDETSETLELMVNVE
ncbi:MAG: hypothetical protein IKP15_03540 [Bacteroidales bacterium]|nr:hypothetical protein [Bacteroidales bacterium]